MKKLSIALGAIALVAVSLVGTTAALADTPHSVYASTVVPKTVTDSDTGSVELGVKLSANVPITISAVRFYQGPGNTGTHTGHIWSASGKSLATATFAASTVQGWKTATLSTPVKVAKNTFVTASYSNPRGRYSADNHGFDKALTDGTVKFDVGAGVYAYGKTSVAPTGTYLNSTYYADIVYTKDDVVTPTPTPTVTTPPVVTPSPTPTVTPSPTPTPTKPPTTGFPTPETTGIPPATNVTVYSGPMTITTANTVIDSKSIAGDLVIRAKGVVVSNSLINGTIYVDADAGLGSVTVTDTTIHIGNTDGTGIGDANFTATRVLINGGNRSVNCYLNCTLQDSYVSGQFKDNTGVFHESGVRMGSGSNILGNYIICDAPNVPPDAGCSADLTGYGDFATVQHNNIIGNFFGNTTGGYCTYGGSTKNKPYSAGVNNIVFKDNVWEKNGRGSCGAYGPITSFDPAAPGNVWTNNKWNDGTTVQSAN